MFDWLYVLGTIDLFIRAFNFALFDLWNSILKIVNGIIFSSLPVSILYTFCSFLTCASLYSSEHYKLYAAECQGCHTHWVKASVTLNLAWYGDFLFFMGLKHHSQLDLVWGPPLLHGSHACIWSAGVLVLIASGPWNSGILLYLPHVLHVCTKC